MVLTFSMVVVAKAISSVVLLVFEATTAVIFGAIDGFLLVVVATMVLIVDSIVGIVLMVAG